MDRRYSKAVRSIWKESHEYVSSEFESLDYDRYGNETVVREEETRGNLFLATTVGQRVFLFVLVGLATGLLGALLDIGVHFGTLTRYALLQLSADLHYPDNLNFMFVIWVASVCFPAILGSLLVIYVDPLASGGGIHWCLAHLNGVNMKSYMTTRILIVKIFSVMLCVIGGLPGGKEAPLVHVGAIVGNNIPLIGFRRFQPFDFFCQEHERRDLAAAGSAAGLSAAFSAPIAGILLSFEESISFWNVELTFLIFICTITSYFMVQFTISLSLHNCPDCFTQKGEFILDIFNGSVENFYLAEIVIYVLLGALGGLLGALWNYIQRYLIIMRKKFINTPVKKFIEILLFSIVIGVVQALILIQLSDNCIPKDPQKIIHDQHHKFHIQLDCDKNKMATGSLFFLQNPVQILRSIFTSDKGSKLGILPLLCFGVYNFVGTNLLTGCAISHGTFIPHVLTGAVWGRLIAEVLLFWLPSTERWVNPNQFAFLLGAAQLSGSLHITYTISMMMLEACNSTRIAIPLFIVVCIAKIVSSFFCESNYHTLCEMNGLPMLEKVGPVSPKLNAIQAMASPVRTLPLKPTFKNIAELLVSCSHNGFPIVEFQKTSTGEAGIRTYGTLKGLMQRSQLGVILYNGLTEEDLYDPSNLRLLRSNPFDIDFEKFEYASDENQTVNLEPFMNSSPYMIHMNAPLPLAYRLFSNLGIRHLVVVDNNLQIVGMITRKDLSIYRFHSKFWMGENKVLPLR